MIAIVIALVLIVSFTVDKLTYLIPVYQFNGLMRFTAGVISWAAVFYIIKISTDVLSLRSREERERVNKKKAERALRESNALMLKAEKLAKLCYIQWDATQTALKLSTSAKHVLELPYNLKPDYNNFIQIVHPDDAAYVEQMKETIFTKKFFPDFYCRVITAKKEVKHLFVRGEAELDGLGKVVKVSAILLDVTEEREYLHKIQLQNQKLKDIAWIQSHKVRSPVATIMGLVELYNKEDAADPVNRKVLEGLHEAAISLDEVIKEINIKAEIV